MKTAYILYRNYLTPDGKQMSVGGIQTYITNLIPIVGRLGYKVHIYQRAVISFNVEKEGVLISGIVCGKEDKDIRQAFRSRLAKEIDKEKDLLIFGTDTLAFKSLDCRSIAIQHGIFWDIPYYQASTRFLYIKNFIGKAKHAWQIIMRVSNVRKLVCVDYNFVNWYRAISAYPLVKLDVIPNFTAIPDNIPSKPSNSINIIFARRFFDYRGTRLFAKAIKPLLASNDKIYITIAGEGPDEDYLRKEFGSISNVTFLKYSSKESLGIHADKHIAVVPTLGSEGTSLSLLEAMASGCAVICTNVGGMTNIVLDHYNGIIINPREDELRDALTELIEDECLRKNISHNAFETVSASFSIKKWRESWERVIKKMDY